jgi:DNA polymerase-1
MLALIDGDILAWRTGTSTEELAVAKQRANDLLDTILTKTQATSYRLFISSRSNFRKSINKDYKSDRPPTPEIVQRMKEYLYETMDAEIAREGLEADDEMGIHQTEETVICTIDKDLLQIPGHHFQWEISGTNKGKKWVKEELSFFQTELEGTRLFYEQCLKGDRTDYVFGIKGLGEKTATKLLKDCQTEKEMLDVCLEKYGHEEKFLMNAQCLYILRDFEDTYLKRYEGLIK